MQKRQGVSWLGSSIVVKKVENKWNFLKLLDKCERSNEIAPFEEILGWNQRVFCNFFFAYVPFQQKTISLKMNFFADYRILWNCG